MRREGGRAGSRAAGRMRVIPWSRDWKYVSGITPWAIKRDLSRLADMDRCAYD